MKFGATRRLARFHHFTTYSKDRLLTPARNGQRSCINLAEAFEFDGAIAQLGERLRGTQEVAGSSPASSTPRESSPVVIGCDDFRTRVSYWLDRASAGEEILLTYRGRPRVRLMPSRPPPAPSA